MKILFYINVLAFGGAERVMTNLANQLHKDGHDIVLVNTWKHENEYCLNSQIKHIYLEESIIENDNLLNKNYRIIKKLRKLLINENPDIAVSFMAEPNIRLLLAKKGLKCKTVISVRNDPVKEYPNKVFMTLIKMLMPSADGVVFQTNDAKNYFNGYFKNCSIIYNPVNEKFYENYEEESNGVINVGRLTNQKNQRLLIEAFSRIVDKCEDNLYIYGDGELFDPLNTYIRELNLQDRVFLMGKTNDVAKKVSKSKLFVMSSDYEGMPNALMEAMALGIPCISTDCPCGGPKELLDSNALVDVNDLEGLSNKMLQFLNDESILAKQAEYNKNKANVFHEKRIFKVWYEYFEEIIRGK